ncbi:MAG: UvrD-helicase domain-containing protein [Bacteroidaceae bacterium]|nr:UvrD-helicase domain-containing protein [Bacteroidaceae bacterium]
MIDYSSELNERQVEAVMSTEGPLMVIAGAGSGKTRVLTYRVAHLLEMGVEPWTILALTFTNKAAGEMKERIAGKVGMERARYLWMGTFHSIFLRILHAESDAIGFSPRFTVYDQADSQSLIRDIVREMHLDDKVYKASVLQNRISSAKNKLVTPDDYIQRQENLKYDQFKKIPLFGQIYMRYCNRCRQADAMDFDDLLLYTYLLFRNNEAILERYASRFRYVLVDEYQDTNYAQHCIVWQLTRESRQVCVVGDDAQSIYSFRGANIDNMLKFTKLYPETKVVKLERNYRSTRNIVGAANSLIEKNRHQIPKTVYSENDKGNPVKVAQVQSDIAEAHWVSDSISRLHFEEDVDYGDVAVLYRTNAQSRVFEEVLRGKSIPYRIYGSLSFYQRKEIKDTIAYMRLVVNHNDEEALKRIINVPARGIGQTTMGRVAAAATESNSSFWNVVSSPLQYGLDFNNGTLAKLGRFVGLIEGLSAMSGTDNAFAVAGKILDESGLLGELQSDHSPEGKEHLENVQELLTGIDSFCRSRMEEGDDRILLTHYLNEVSLLTDQDNDKEGDEHKVTLMTVHAAKGLEFDSVYVVGMEDNLFPSQMCQDDERQLEEERRLFYVAITRAKRHCTLLYSKCRFRYGNVEMSEPSRFIRDIDSRFLEFQFGGSDGRKSESAPSRLRTAVRPERFFESRGYPGGDNDTSFFGSGRKVATKFEPKSSATANTVPGRDAGRGRFQSVSTLLSSGASGSGLANTPLTEGDIIEHERFGRGKVLYVEGSGDGRKAKICFDNAGEKTLLLKFARFTVIDD